jgi:hypothetical protein
MPDVMYWLMVEERKNDDVYPAVPAVERYGRLEGR